ncbi:hypothetical protein AVEN_119829-1 [Araneus ventricosus]|uniref:CCHC-type domain-containing protein n=1 Tax=Araneus ventricosus TaxID=182803 RepID=A0A4Y2MUM7_ARAVE|nr:hypothetical protein AVEN_69655-1 [Araneus ventricosus]GBN29346.1 hypothetical protein AVEN_119829-1 [Araneus ventricosus]
MVKKGTTQKNNAPDKDGEGPQPSNSEKYANDLRIMIDKMNPGDYTEEAYPIILEWFNNLEKFSTEMVDGGLTYGKLMRNNFVKLHYRELLPILQELCFEIRKRDADIFDLKLSLAESDHSLLKAKVWTLERENIALRAKLDLNNSIAETVKELLPKLDEIKNSNAQSLRDQLPSIIKDAACPEIKSSLEIVNREIVAEVKKSRVEARYFAQVALQGKDKRQGPSMVLTPKEPEGVLLIKPKSETLKDFEINRKIFLDILQTKRPDARLRGVVKIFGGGVKLIAASPDDISSIKDTFLEHGDKETMEKYEFVTPNRRSPQFILYNVPKDTEENTLKTGLIAKNLTLADGNNRPQFNLEFSIPARDSRFNHWVMTINPKKYEDFKSKEGLYFQFTRLRLSEFISVKQCKKCFAFGHTTKGCDPSNKQLCDKCGEVKEESHRCRGHSCINCKESNRKARTDYKTDHSCLDRNCNVLIKQKEIVMRRTDYGL